MRMYCLPPSFQALSQALYIHYFNNMSNLGPLSINRYRNVLSWWSHTSYPGNRTPATTLLPTSLPMMPSPANSNAFLRPSQFLVGWVVNVHQTNEKTRFQTNVLVLGWWLPESSDLEGASTSTVQHRTRVNKGTETGLTKWACQC